MRLYIKSLFTIGFALFVHSAPFADRAEGGIALGNPIVISGGDPWYIYTVPVFYDPLDTFLPATGPNFMDPVDPDVDDYLTIYNIRGFTNVVGFFDNPDWTGVQAGFTGTGLPGGTGYTPPAQTAPPVDSFPDLADVTLYRVRGHDPVTNLEGLQALLGYFVIQAQLPTGIEPTMTFDYTWQIRNLGTGMSTSGSGSVMVVPEPGALILLGLGLAVVSGIGRARHVRRTRMAAGPLRAS